MLRLLVCDVARTDEPPQPMSLINPEITWASSSPCTAEEGCLSLPEFYAEVTRPDAVRVRYLDEQGTPHEIAAKGLMAACLQHEIDHLNGILFIDHLSALKRNMILRKLRKNRRLGEPAAAP